MYNEIINKHSDWIDSVWNKIDNKMQYIAPTKLNTIPYIANKEGKYDNCAAVNSQYGISWWCNGFWAGYMWLLYIGTGRDIYKVAAENVENLLDGAFKDYDNLHHDVGFMWHISAGVNYRLTGNKTSRLRELYAGDILAARYNPNGKYIRSWNNNIDTNGYHKLIIDSMMNIPLLYWMSKERQDIHYKNIAVNHADTIINTHIRTDGTVHHIVELNPEDGSPVNILRGQGYDVGSSWTRGQAWAIYGFILSYIHTKDEKYLNAAKNAANAFISCASLNDWIIPIDFRQPEHPDCYDSSAAACAACGIIEISKYVSEYDCRNYLNAAIKLLRVLDEKAADYTLDKEYLINYASVAYHSDEINTAIVYGDFFYTEAIYKLKGFKPLLW